MVSLNKSLDILGSFNIHSWFKIRTYPYQNGLWRSDRNWILNLVRLETDPNIAWDWEVDMYI